MQIEQFDYHLPPERIAQAPVEPRDAARMMVLERAGGIHHAHVRDLPAFLRAGDIVVVNNSRVIPARVFARKPTGGRAEVLFLREESADTWRVLLGRARGIRPRSVLFFGENAAQGEVLESLPGGEFRLRISGLSPWEVMQRWGQMPLPPYIRRPAIPGYDDQRYQTIFAERPGSVAAPTAGLHFTPELIERLAQNRISVVSITLHVGVGTFRPIQTERVEDHQMSPEYFEISQQAAEAIQTARARGGRVVAVGTTVVRTLETVAQRHGRVVPDRGESNLYICPPFSFRAIDALLTNFHLPKSTPLVLVSAFAGRERLLEAYREAIERGYRFYSYGDCMLIL